MAKTPKWEGSKADQKADKSDVMKMKKDAAAKAKRKGGKKK